MMDGKQYQGKLKTVSLMTVGSLRLSRKPLPYVRTVPPWDRKVSTSIRAELNHDAGVNGSSLQGLVRRWAASWCNGIVLRLSDQTGQTLLTPERLDVRRIRQSYACGRR